MILSYRQAKLAPYLLQKKSKFSKLLYHYMNFQHALYVFTLYYYLLLVTLRINFDAIGLEYNYILQLLLQKTYYEEKLHIFKITQTRVKKRFILIVVKKIRRRQKDYGVIIFSNTYFLLMVSFGYY